jgi:regulator of protease activity HflC (stomatin/prohibitin superfamily)
MMKKITIQNDQRGLLFRGGNYHSLLKPGRYRLWRFRNEQVEVLNVNEPFTVPNLALDLFLQDPELLAALDVVDVADDEVVVQFEAGRYVATLKSGKYAFWNVLRKYSYQRFQLRETEVPKTMDRVVLQRLMSLVQTFTVQNHEKGILLFDQQVQRILEPGIYHFWRNATVVSVKNVDLRQQQMDMTGQEIMTEDKVTLRLNFVCQYQITDPLRTLAIKSFEEQVYIQLQLILREYVGTLKLDDLLRMKKEIAEFVLTRLNEKSEDYGVRFLHAGVKDIMLPGEIKDILNTVLLAEKKAQANIITRREETASTRSLLNTAKIMDENKTLYRLKELEFLEKICEKIGTISLGGGDPLLDKLNRLIGN